MVRYAITDGSLGWKLEWKAAERLVGRSAELAAGGVDFLLVREKGLAAGDLTRVSRQIVDAVRGSGMRVLIARRVDVAIAAGADGVHLSAVEGELTPGQVREVFPAALVSVSCHSVDEVRRARGASMVLFAPVFGKTVDGVEVVRGAGLDRLREARSVAGEMPVLALGGVTGGNAAECVAAGATGVAGIRMFFGQEAKCVREVRREGERRT